jgi:hypothetical protein
MATIINGTTGVDKVVDGSIEFVDLAAAAIASQAEAEAGSISTKLMTAQRVGQAVAALAGGIADYQAYTTGSGTWTKPSGLSSRAMVRIQMWSSGSSGASRATTGNAGGGGAGHYIDTMIPASVFAATESYIVGAAVAGVTGDTTGITGNVSTFTVGGVVFSTGKPTGGESAITGAGAYGASASPMPSIGGEVFQSEAYHTHTFGFGAQNDGSPGNGNPGSVTTANAPRAGYSTVYAGGGAGSSSTAGGVRTGGKSVFGGQGGDGGANTGGNGGTGTAPGGGGGGAVQGGTSGGGARGEIRITVFD